MTKQTNVRAIIDAASRWAALALLLSLCGLLAAAIPTPQEEEDSTRRLWNKQFEAARAKAKQAKQPAKSQTQETKQQQAAVDGELVGITIWRLRAAAAGSEMGGPRLLVHKDGATTGQYQLERAEADAPFDEGQRLRLSVETPREGESYLYVIDREVYADGTLGEPALIFPARTTPPGGNMTTAGKVIFVPAQGDPLPYFTLQRSSKKHVSEMVTLIISPAPLPLEAGQMNLDPAQVAQWEKQWGGPTERREARGGAGQQWTLAEQEADKGERKLVQGDPLPQTIYRVKTKSGGPVLVNLLLQIAP